LRNKAGLIDDNPGLLGDNLGLLLLQKSQVSVGAEVQKGRKGASPLCAPQEKDIITSSDGQYSFYDYFLYF